MCVSESNHVQGICEQMVAAARESIQERAARCIENRERQFPRRGLGFRRTEAILIVVAITITIAVVVAVAIAILVACCSQP